METKKKQVIRYNEKELELIKVFADNDDLLKAIRKVFLQMPLSPLEASSIAMTFAGKPEILALVSKTFKPELDGDAPLHQLIDLWCSVDVKDKDVLTLDYTFKSRQLLINLLNQQLEELEAIANKKSFERKIVLAELVGYSQDSEPVAYATNLIARNTLITHTDAQLTQLSILAGKKDETPEETIARLSKDSTR